MTLDDINKLDFKNIGSWPLVARAVLLLIIFVVVLAAAYWFDWSDQIDTLQSARQQEAQEKDTFLSKKQQAINLDTYKQQLKEIEQSFGALLKQLPNKSEMDALITDINQAGLGRGLEFELFKPADRETMSEFYAELPIAIKVTGAYHDLAAFASDVSQLSRIVTLNDIKLHPDNKTGLLTMDVTAKTYRYLDEDEIASQKKAEKDKKGGK